MVVNNICDDSQNLQDGILLLWFGLKVSSSHGKRMAELKFLKSTSFVDSDAEVVVRFAIRIRHLHADRRLFAELKPDRQCDRGA
jgi:hypothetical protein